MKRIAALSTPWVVVREGDRQRWGAEIRRRRIFEALAERTSARVVDGWTARQLVEGVNASPWDALRLRRPFRALVRPPRLAASEMLSEKVVETARRIADPAVVAVYDDAVSQLHAFGLTVSADRIRELRRRRTDNLEAFRWHVVPTESFARLVDLDRDRIIVGGNGTDPDHIRPLPWPEEPAIGVVSGAGPGRGLESLIEAARILRAEVPGLHLLLWLVATSPESEDYLDRLRGSVAQENWVEVGSVDYRDLASALGRATVLCIPHPANDYLDVALPVKLFDSMASGRPLVVTPRLETQAVIRAARAGVVSHGDTPADLAAAAGRLFADERLAQAMGEAGREAAVTQFDWRIRSAAIADAVLDRESSAGRGSGVASIHQQL